MGFLVIVKYSKNQVYGIGSLFHEPTTYYRTKRYV